MTVDPEDPSRPGVYAGLLEDTAGRPRAKILGAQVIQHCPLCFREDQVPYIRRAWCFDTTVVCEHHSVRLRSTCAACGRGWSPFTRYGGMSSFTMCSRCGADLRHATPEWIPEALHDRLVAFQKQVLSLQPETRVPLGHRHVAGGIRYARFVQLLLRIIRFYGLHALLDPEAWDLRVREEAGVTALPLAEQRLRAVATVAWCLEDLSQHLPALAWRMLSPQRSVEVALLRQFMRDDLRFQWLMNGLAHAPSREALKIVLTWVPALPSRTVSSALEGRLSAKGRASAASLPPFELTNAQWEIAESALPAYGHRPRYGKHEARLLFEGILHGLTSGTPWQKLPSVFPSGPATHDALSRWRASGALGAMLTRLFEAMHLEGRVNLVKHVHTPERTPPEWRALADAFLSVRMIEELRSLNPRLHHRLAEVYITQKQGAER